MDVLLATLLSYLLLYKYVAIVVVIFLSGLILPLQSNTLLLAAGAFASQNYLNIELLFFTALCANVLGDSVGYALTRFWGTRIITNAYLKRFSAFMRIEQFIYEHTRLTILITRFLGIPGVVVNFMSGLLKIPFRRFVLYDVIGNALDIALFLFIGFVLGVYTENISDMTQLIGWLVVVVLLIFLVVKFFFKKNTSHTS